MSEIDSELGSLPATFLDTASQLTSLSQLHSAEEECLYKGRRFIVVDHQPNRRSGTPVSEIWEHGAKYRLIGAVDNSRFWRCGHYRRALLIDVGDSTKSALRHVRVAHPQQLARQVDRADRSTPNSEKSSRISSLVFSLDVNKFRWLLIR